MEKLQEAHDVLTHQNQILAWFSSEKKELVQFLILQNEERNKDVLIQKYKNKDMSLIKRVLVDVCNMFVVVI